MNNTYKVRQELRPKDLMGMSEAQIAQHWALYEGYVSSVNKLNQRLAELAQKGDFSAEFSELKRRVGFEYNGMILHEHYFGILKAGQPTLGEDSALTKQFKKCFGGFERWKEEFSAIGKMRGVGWVILYLNPGNGLLTNHWISLHEEGHPAGFVPLLVMDVWEHAYMVDLGAGGRQLYVGCFLRNVDWAKVERNLKQAASPAAIAMPGIAPAHSGRH